MKNGCGPARGVTPISSSPTTSAGRPQQPLLPGVQAAPRTRRACGRGLYLPHAAAHLRDDPVDETRAPESGPVAPRTLFHHADDGHLLAPNGRHRWRRRERLRRGFRIGESGSMVSQWCQMAPGSSLGASCFSGFCRNFSRVTDGARTRDLRDHNPSSTFWSVLGC